MKEMHVNRICPLKFAASSTSSEESFALLLLSVKTIGYVASYLDFTGPRTQKEYDNVLYTST